jgi:hypothetical protein
MPSLVEEALVSPAKADVVSEQNLSLPSLTISGRESEALRGLAEAANGAALPVEWVVDVADSNLNWFIATAYSFDDAASTVRVAIPDREEPQWEGDLPLDHRTIHLIECCDEESAALYKHLVSKATAAINWRVEWWFEGDGGDAGGKWFAGTAKYYGRLANVIHVASEPDAEELMELGVDENLKLLEVVGEAGGHADFESLVVEGIVQWDGPEEQPEADPIAAIAKRPSRALEASLEELERLASDMARCLADSLRMRCASDVEHGEVTDRLRRHVVRAPAHVKSAMARRDLRT